MATLTAGAGSTTWTAASFSGGAASTAADEVIVPTGATLTISAANTVLCRSFSVTGTGTIVFAATTSVMTVGDATAGTSNVAISIASGGTVTLTGIGTINLVSTSATTQTITSNGKTLPSITVNGAGSNYQFADNTRLNNLVYTAGASIDFNSKTITPSTFVISSNSNTRTVTFGTAVVNCSLFGGAPFNASGATNVTVSASTGAQINATAANNPTINLGSIDYSNVAISHTTASLSNNTLVSSGATIYSYSRTGTANKTEVFFLSGTGVTVTNSFTVSANSATNRMLVQAYTVGTAFTLTNNGSYTLASVDFQDITFAGTASTNFASITGNSGDCGGNSGATFTTPATQNYDGTAGNWSTAARWTSRVPLPQDDVTFSTSSAAVSLDMPRCGQNVNFTNYSGTLTWTSGLGQTFYGSLTISSGMTNSFGNTVNFVFAGRGSYTFDSAGKTFTGTNLTTTISCATGTYSLSSAYTTGHAISLLSGTFNTAGYTVTALSFSNTGTITRTLNLSSSTFNLTSTTGTSWSWTATGATLVAGTSEIVISTTSASTRTFAGGGAAYNKLTYTIAGSTGQLTITGASYYDTINFSDSSNARTIVFPISTLNVIKTLNIQGTSGKLMTIASSTGGTATYLELVGGLPSVDYLTVTDVFSTIPYKFYAGANSSTSGVSTNIFTTVAPSGPYIVKQAETSGTATSATPTFAFNMSASANNLLVATLGPDNDPGTVTTPTGYTANPDNPSSATSPRAYMFYKQASGGETSVTIAYVNNLTAGAKLYEIGGFTGTPTLDVRDKNNSASSSVTSLSTGSGVSNTANPAIAIAMWSAISSMGNTVSFSNSFQEQRGAAQQSNNRWAVKQLTSNASVTATNTWTTSRAAASMMLIFIDVASGNNWTQNLNDSVTVTDDVIKVIGKFLSDTATGTDSLTKTIELLKGDTVTVSDALTKAITKLIADAVTPTDAINAVVSYVRSLSDSVTTSDNITASQGQNFQKSLSDLVTAVDNLTYTNAQIVSQIVSIIVDAALEVVTINSDGSPVSIQSESNSAIIDTEVKA